MAKYYPTCEDCGKEFQVDLTGPRRDREYKLKNYRWICDPCREVAKEKASKEAAAAAEEIGLPELVGTEKQVRWAEVLRLDAIRRIDEFIAQRGASPGKEDEVKHLLAEVKGQKAASFWIDHREHSGRYILEEFLRKNPPTVAQRSLESEAASDVTVRPAKILSETVAEIRVYQDSVEIIFPEKREDFWQLVKKELNYRWSETRWVRQIGKSAGTPKDRAAEAGHLILAAGFPIRIHDEEVRRMAIDGSYVPECVKWVLP